MSLEVDLDIAVAILGALISFLGLPKKIVLLHPKGSERNKRRTLARRYPSQLHPTCSGTFWPFGVKKLRNI